MSFADILKREEERLASKLASKIPSWAGAQLSLPTSLCVEQCSSEATAMYKASLVGEVCGGAAPLRIADLTGGLGVDSWAFSRCGEAVLYNERNESLAEAVRQNFACLGARNVSFSCFEVDATASQWAEAVRRFRPDWIYLDPARRGVQGQKVFRIEDCQPDVVSLLPALAALSPHILVKLSPMADISVLSKAFGRCLDAVHVVASAGEVKELLCVLDSKKYDAGKVDTNSEAVSNPVIVAADLSMDSGPQKFSFHRTDEASSTVSISEPLDYLYEPRPVLMKAGAFKLYCSSFALHKLDISTHLYTSRQQLDLPLFKAYRILDIRHFNKAGMLSLAGEYPHAEVSARNIPVTSDQLRMKMKITPGQSNGIHIFACLSRGEKMFVTCKKL